MQGSTSALSPAALGRLINQAAPASVWRAQRHVSRPCMASVRMPSGAILCGAP